MDDVSTLIARIDSLLDSPSEGDSADVRAHMETTLTDGYAGALALQAEQERLQRNIGAIAADLAEGRGKPRTKELASLARRLAVSEEELASLRDTLAELKGRLALAARAA
jgi:uncharacterized protein involved in exopolysaccharide biosynthesis